MVGLKLSYSLVNLGLGIQEMLREAITLASPGTAAPWYSFPGTSLMCRTRCLYPHPLSLPYLLHDIAPGRNDKRLKPAWRIRFNPIGVCPLAQQMGRLLHTFAIINVINE